VDWGFQGDLYGDEGYLGVEYWTLVSFSFSFPWFNMLVINFTDLD
jgi:hypothetical protein